MLGYAIGVICLIGIFVLLRRGHRHGPGYRRGRRRMLWHLFERLETQPGQEKAIVAEVDAFLNEARGLKAQWHNARKSLAEAISGPSFDESRARAWLAERR